MKLQNSKTINGVLDALNVGLESRPELVSSAVARQIAYELPLPAGPVNSVTAAFNEQRPVVEAELAKVNEQYLLPNIDEAVETTRKFWTARYQLAHEPSAPGVRALVDQTQTLPASGGLLATVAAVFDGGAPIAAVESLLYAPCELVAAGLDRAALESIVSAEDRPAMEAHFSEIENLRAEIALTVSSGMESLAGDFASLEDEGADAEAAALTPASPEKKSLMKRVGDALLRFFRWVGDQFRLLWDKITGREKRAKALLAAAEVDMEAVGEAVAKALKEELAASAKTAEQGEKLKAGSQKLQASLDRLAAPRDRLDALKDTPGFERMHIVGLIASRHPAWVACETILKTIPDYGKALGDKVDVIMSTQDEATLISAIADLEHGFVYDPWTKLSVPSISSDSPADVVLRAARASLLAAARTANPTFGAGNLFHATTKAFGDDKFFKHMRDVNKNVGEWKREAEASTRKLEQFANTQTATNEVLDAMRELNMSRVRTCQAILQITVVYTGAYQEAFRYLNAVASDLRVAYDDIAAEDVDAYLRQAGLNVSEIKMLKDLEDLAGL